MRYAISILVTLLFFPLQVLANTPPIVSKILSGEELSLNDGRIVQLDGIYAPDNTANAELEKLAVGNSITLEDGSTDRYGRVDAQAYVQGNGKQIWLQGELLRDGLAFVYLPAAADPHLEDMLKLESEARVSKRGIWAQNAWADIPAEKASEKLGQFGFIAGKVLKAERIKNHIYLNFGEDWRKDFEIVIAAHDLHFFKKAGIDPLSYEGKTIRVRGWITRDPGPVIEVANPGGIEILDIR